jgi:hypothetical protein
MQMLRATPDIEQDAPISSALDSLRVTLLSQLDTAIQLATAGEWNAVQLRLAIQIPAVIEFSSLLVERVDQQALQQRSKAIEDAQKARQRLFMIVPIAALLKLLAAAALGWYVTRTVTGPLSVLTACAEAPARGDFQHHSSIYAGMMSWLSWGTPSTMPPSSFRSSMRISGGVNESFGTSSKRCRRWSGSRRPMGRMSSGIAAGRNIRVCPTRGRSARVAKTPFTPQT